MTTSADGAAILESLRRVEEERRLRAAGGDLDRRAHAVKHYQHVRFERSYADLFEQPRYAAAIRFFLDELYGPHDFSARDAQVARIVPALTRLFPQHIVATVRNLAELHALSESLDSAMAHALPPATTAIDAPTYIAAWQAVGRPEARQRQVELMLQIGAELDRHTRKPLLAYSLRLMRGPSRAAGLAALQTFLETGFETFRALGGAQPFLELVTSRERTLIEALFAAPVAAPPPEGCLRQLP